MKTYKDVYQFPLHLTNTWIFDNKNQFVAQFERQYDNKGNYDNLWMEFEFKILNCLNGVGKHPYLIDSVFEYDVNNQHIYLNDGETKTLIITIRGFGNLAGQRGHNLSNKEAANIQDTFAEFIVNKLNNKKT
jgi:hypothetical protein